MPLYVILGFDGPHGVERRPAVRPRHLEHLRPLDAAGRILVAGPLFADDGKTPRGSLEEVFDRYEVRPFARVFPEAK